MASSKHRSSPRGTDWARPVSGPAILGPMVMVIGSVITAKPRPTLLSVGNRLSGPPDAPPNTSRGWDTEPIPRHSAPISPWIRSTPVHSSCMDAAGAAVICRGIKPRYHRRASLSPCVRATGTSLSESACALESLLALHNHA
eukprot:1311961-Pyramimonas_sp.AAC.1